MPAGPETTTPQTGDPSAAIPVQAVSQGDDLAAPLQTVLRQINVLPQPGDSAKTKGATGALKGTPSSVAVIESGATALSKGWTALIGALGGTTVIVGAVQKFWTGQSGGIRIALVASFAGFMSVTVIAIAIMVGSDVRGRAIGSVARYETRSAVTVAFLEAVANLSMANRPTPGAAGSAENGQAAQAPAVDEATMKLQSLIALASSGVQAAITQAPTGLSGNLHGLRTSSGELQVLFVPAQPADAAQSDWCSIDDVSLVEHSY